MVDYGFYIAEYRGSLTAEQFDAVAAKAHAFVTKITFPNVPETDGQTVAFNRAVCRVADVLAKHGTGSTISFKVGDFSMSGGDSPNAMATEAAEDELLPTGLLFMGVC